MCGAMDAILFFFIMMWYLLPSNSNYAINHTNNSLESINKSVLISKRLWMFD